MIVINPIMSGGLSLAKLAAATAAPEDVLEGKKFYAGGKEIKTGTLQPHYYASGIFSLEGGASKTIPFGFTADFVGLAVLYSNYEIFAFNMLFPTSLASASWENVTGLTVSGNASSLTVQCAAGRYNYKLRYYAAG